MKTKTIFENGIYLPTLNKKCTPIRFCPECNHCVPHFNNQKRDISIREKRLCCKCARKGERNTFYGKQHTPETIKIITKKNTGRKAWNSGKKGLYKPTLESKIKTSNSMKGKHAGIKNPYYGKKHSPEIREKMRLIQIENRKKLKLQRGEWGCYNPKACGYLNELSNKMGWNIQHAENGGEYKVIGYSLDGYDKDKNIVIEYDEPRHKRQKEYDIKRQNEIINRLRCEFYRYDEYTNTLYKVNQ